MEQRCFEFDDISVLITNLTSKRKRDSEKNQLAISRILIILKAILKAGKKAYFAQTPQVLMENGSPSRFGAHWSHTHIRDSSFFTVSILCNPICDIMATFA
jgi:hypothetical protein